MKINNSKIVVGILLSLIIWCVFAVFATKYQTLSVTGSNLETFRVLPKAVISVEHVGNYHAKIDSCDKFSVKTDSGIVLEGIPQDLKGTRCGDSYYKIEDKEFNVDTIEIVSGTPFVTLSADSPLGVTAGFPAEMANNDLSRSAFATLWIWLVVMAIVFVPNWE